MSDLDKALEVKLQGNECYKKNEFEAAVKHYTEAIKICPASKSSDLSIMYQNRAAALERLEKLDDALKDCHESLKLNNRYGKSYDRRSKILKKVVDTLDNTKLDDKIRHLRQALEDVSVLAYLDGYQHQQLVMVDDILKQLSSALAIVTAKTREPVMPSHYTIGQYFASFIEDPLLESVSQDGSYARAKQSYDNKEFEQIIGLCDEEIQGKGPDQLRAKLLKATFLVLTKQLSKAMDLLTELIDESNEETDTKVLVNALVKRGSLYIQQCQDPQNDAILSFGDFDRAAKIDSDNADVFFNRGQINLLLDKFDAAKDDLEKAASLRPEFAIANVQNLYTKFLESQLKHDINKVEEIEKSFQAAIDKYPDCVEAYALYAKILQETGKLQDADDVYKRGLVVNPENANLIVYRALLYLQQTGDVNKAIEDMNKAVAMDDKCEFAYETIGQIEIQRGDLEAAVKSFQKAIPLVNTELEMAHLFGLCESASAKLIAKKKLQEVPTGEF